MSVRIVKIEANECTCERCGAKWIPRPVFEKGKWITPLSIACPSCKQSYWNRPRKDSKEK
jgi:hypothetical protein